MLEKYKSKCKMGYIIASLGKIQAGYCLIFEFENFINISHIFAKVY